MYFLKNKIQYYSLNNTLMWKVEMTFSAKKKYCIILMFGLVPISCPFSDHAALHYCDCACTATLPRLWTFFRRCSAIIWLTFAPDWSLTSGSRCNLLPLCLDYLLQFTQWSGQRWVRRLEASARAEVTITCRKTVSPFIWQKLFFLFLLSSSPMNGDERGDARVEHMM